VRPASGWADRLRAYKIVIDGEVAGTVRAGRERSFALSPGRHEVAAKVDWASSAPLQVELAEDDVTLECRPKGNPAKAVGNITVRRNDYIELRLVA
jgi:hypothetical protein